MNARDAAGPLVKLFQLTQEVVYPQGTDPSEPDVPYTEQARQVWWNPADNRYGNIDHSPDTTLYLPTALRDANGLPQGTPALGPGMRCYGWYNRQSGRWEILAPALIVVRVELKATLVPDDASVAAALIDSPSEPEITVYLRMADWHGIGRAGSGEYGHAGTLGYAIFSPVRGRWELLCLQGKLLAEAKADGPIATGAIGTVSLWWKDYATGSLVDSRIALSALNWLGPDLASGDPCIVSYDRQENRWTIVATSRA